MRNYSGMHLIVRSIFGRPNQNIYFDLGKEFEYKRPLNIKIGMKRFFKRVPDVLIPRRFGIISHIDCMIAPIADFHCSTPDTSDINCRRFRITFSHDASGTLDYGAIPHIEYK